MSQGGKQVGICLGLLLVLSAACAAQDRRVQRVNPPPGFGEPGVRIRQPGARRFVIAFLSEVPVQIVGVSDERGEPVGVPELLALAGARFDNGIVVADDCGEHVRLGETVLRGVIQNRSDRALRVEFGSGREVLLRPAQTIYVGEFDVIDDPDVATAIATHQWECLCTCETEGGQSASISYDCGNCGEEGNQCRAGEGAQCIFDPDGDGPQEPVTGTTTDCQEVLVPKTQPPGGGIGGGRP
jgi:hypothetical protein